MNDTNKEAASVMDAHRAKLKKLFTVLKLLALLLIIVAVPVYILVFHQDWLAVMSDLDQMRALIAQYKGIEAAFIYVAAQIIQIIISVIPGQALQIAAGFMFGFPIALGLSVIGAIVGTVITYYLGKVLGRDAMHLIFGEEQISRYVAQMNSRKAAAIVFLIYLIPGIPKDVVSYAAGVSSMKLRPFLLLSLVGRLPGMIASLLIGKQIFDGDYHVAIIIAVIATVLFILGLVFRKRLMAWFDKAYTKIYAYDELASEMQQIKHEQHAEKRAEIKQKITEKAKQKTKGGSHEM